MRAPRFCSGLALLRPCSAPALLSFSFCRCWAPPVTRETRDTRRAAHMDVRRVPPWAGCPMWHLPAQATHSWLLTRNSQCVFFGYFLCRFGQRK
ncbi:hypothetical protein [Lysobacter gummosus]|uniref:hypothetical protein n=1 Tax=Lysobacter gummosus TaxID=262324 RepID=UPI003640EB44